MIPKIDVRGLAAKKIDTGELSFDYEAPDDLIDIPFVAFSSPVRVSLRYEIFEDNAVEVNGFVRFSLKGNCSRCMSETEQVFEENAEGVFKPGEGDGIDYGYRNGSVDLSEFVRDAVLIALPPRLLCGECNDPEGEQE